MKIDFTGIESKWKKEWEDSGVYRVTHVSDKPKYYVLDMFPYPSGAGLHVGHPLGYIASDIVSRFKRMDGYNVLHPMGYDSFGLPAEQYAIQTGIHPAVSTKENIRRFRAQLFNLGLSFDWSREVKTSDPEFYKWTQWIFLQLYAHYYDTSQNKPRSIIELIAHFERSGNHGITAANSLEDDFTADEWNAMSPKDRDEILMNFRLAYRKVSFVNWCEELGTVLANDEVKDGVSERGGFPVERRAMLQWSLRITAYAQRLLDDLQDLDWSDAMKSMQSNWIGRSEGARLYFRVDGHDDDIVIYTTRPDTIFGATFMVLAPEHPLVDKITTADCQKDVVEYMEYVKSRTERERLADATGVTGAFTGAHAVNPVTGDHIPVWIADYVLMDYGTGAIMAVPGDDTRDLNFAEHFGLPVIQVVDRSEYPEASLQDKVGRMVNSGFLNGLEVVDALQKILEHIETEKLGQREVQFRLRDAIYSRQRYWGEPIPVIYDSNGVSSPLPFEELPLELPEIEDYTPSSTGSPLSRATKWVNLPGNFKRDTDTMPGYAGSSWYFLRYMDAHNSDAFASLETIQYWRDVDLYIGGTEHAVGHLMYSRFWHKFLHDLGYVPTVEPFKRLINQGMIQGTIEYLYMYKEKVKGKSKFLCAKLAANEDPDQFVKIAIKVDLVKRYGSPDSHLTTEGIKALIDWRPEYADAVFECANGVFENGRFNAKKDAASNLLYTESEVGKMGKRYHNAVNPDDIIAEYGADCFRMYEMFLGPVEQSKPWDTNNIDGVSRFVRRFWSLFYNANDQWIADDSEPSEESLKTLHRAIKRVREDLDRYSFNTCVSHFMTAVNEWKKQGVKSLTILEPAVRIIAPFAPFLAEELWHAMGQTTSVHHASYPVADESLLEESTVTYPVCVNGKKRAELQIPADAANDVIETRATELEGIQKWLDGKPVRKVIIVPGRMINIVI